MTSKLSDQLLRKIQSLPALPGSVEQLCHLTSSVETDFDRISQIISTDEALTSKLLQVVNSPFYGLSQKINTIPEAIVTLGFQGVRSLALGISVVGCHGGSGGLHLFNKPTPLTRENLWRHSLAAATVGRKLSGLLGMQEQEQVFVGGLLHDIGKIILLDFFHKEYAAVAEAAEQGTRTLRSLEDEAFGMDHSALGGELCRRWKIPAELAGMVSRTDAAAPGGGPASTEDRMLQAVHFGNCVARIAAIGFDANPFINLDLLRIPELNGIEERQIDEILSTLSEEVHRAEALFGIAKRGHALRREHHAPPLEVTVCVSDSRERMATRMSLLAMGYTSRPDASVEEGPPPSAAIADDSLPASLKESFDANSIPVLDFSQWRNENIQVDNTNRLPIQKLQEWLKASLPK